jgi:hypothetical protein
MNGWVIRSIKDVQKLWLKVREVTRRAEGHRHHHEEQYSLGVYLLALGRHELLEYPFTVKQGESPDFIVTDKSGEVTGLQVTRATEPWLQREMTKADREYRRRELAAESSGSEPEPVVIELSQSGWIGDEAENQWCILVRRAIERKISKLPVFAPVVRHDLLVCDDTPLPAVDRRKVLAALTPWARDLKSRTPTLGRISIVVSLDVLFDVSGSSRILPYVHWSEPDLDDTPSQSFSERAELAGKVEVERAIREPSRYRIPTSKNPAPAYYIGPNGRIIKRTPEGRRFEVRIKENGGEIVVRELREALGSGWLRVRTEPVKPHTPGVSRLRSRNS